MPQHTKTSICNAALRLLGQPALVEDAESDAPQAYDDAQAVVDAYDARIGRVLRSHNWNFAETLAELEADPTAPAFGFARRFALPSDFAKFWSLDPAYGANPPPPYKLRGAYIETDLAAPLRIVYGRRETDPSLFDDAFADALAAEVAAKAALAVLGSKEAARAFRGETKDDQADARHDDARDNPPVEPYEGTWVPGRRTG